MIQAKKIKLYISLYGYILSVAMVVVLFSSGVFAGTGQLEIRGGEHDKYSRIVFDWGKEVKYKSKRSDGVVDIIFEAKTGKPNMSSVKPSELSGLKGIKYIKMSHDITYIRLALPKGGKYRGYRLGKRIIFDLYTPKKSKVKKIRKAEIPKSTPYKKPVVIHAVEVAKKVTDPKAEERPKEVVAEKTVHHVVETVPKVIPVEVKKTEVKPLAVGYTTITLSTIEPVSMAVFERFGSLWMVIDNDFASIVPLVAGPFISVLGEPEKVKIKGGVAYRFKMPKQAMIANISFQNLSWIISLKPKGKDTAMMNAGQLRRIIRPNQKPRAEIFMSGTDKVLKLRDNKAGDDVYVVTSKDAGSYISLDMRYPEFAILRAYQGSVIQPFTDNLTVKRVKNKILIDSPNGLIMTENLAELPTSNITGDQLKHAKKGDDVSRLFDFYGWQRGGLDYLRENQRKIEAKIADAKSSDELASVYLEMALLYFANDYGHEAIGALRAASMENPELLKTPGFLAVKGGAEAIAGFSHEAIRDLSTTGLKNHPEARLWRGYAAAASEQWVLAGKMFPKTNDIITRYPSNMAIPFTLYMAESALRLGDTVRAKALLQTLTNMSKDMKSEQKAAEQYLKGEAYRQEGEPIKALKAWYPVVNGRNQLYYVKASLATVDLLKKVKRISAEAAQDRLETLRYVWRGDGLEIQMLHNIARLYLEKKEYIKGLEEMRKAVSLSEEILQDSSVLMVDMEKIFSDLYVTEKAGKMEPFNAVSIYNSFKELMPSGYDSYIAEQNYAGYLIEMDLLDEAAKIFEKQINYDWPDKNRVSEIGARLASIYLLDGKAQKALSVLQRTGRKELTETLIEKRELLRAGALSELGMEKQAIQSLEGIDSPEAEKLKANIYWRNRDWAKAAETLLGLLASPEEIKSTKDMSDSELVLNTAVAYKLANSKEELQKLRSKYLDAMRGTAYGSSFAVVSRNVEGVSSLKDKQTIMSMAAEVDLFKGFLKDYQMTKLY